MQNNDRTPTSQPTELTPTQEHEVRLAKLKELEKRGMSPWPEFKPVSATIVEVIADREKMAKDEESAEVYAIAGRMMAKRAHGKTMFAQLQDRSGSIQIYLRKDALGDELFDAIQHLFDLGDYLWVKGPIFFTKTGELTVKVNEITLLSKCLHPLPEKFHGLADVEVRYRQRYLDLMTNAESREKFRKRSEVLYQIRQFLVDKDFIEVETPMLHPIPGGAAARPFVTHHNAYDMDLFLRIAPELYLKRLVVGGFERVFEINRNFRNEGVSTRHNPEFTMIEFYMAHGDYHDGIALTESLLQAVVQKAVGSLDVPFGDKMLSFKAPFARFTVKEALMKIGEFSEAQVSEKGIDNVIERYNIELPNKKATYGEKLFLLFEEFVEEKIVQPTFIVGYPVEVSPLAKRDPKNPQLAARFELFIAGMELANGFSELNDPIDQAERFRKQSDAREGGDAEAHHYDAEYIKALEYGLPPAVGVGIGIDRLVMMCTNTTSIKDVILFPTLKVKHESK